MQVNISKVNDWHVLPERIAGTYIAIDQGATVYGFAVVKQGVIIDHGAVKLRGFTIYERIDNLGDSLLYQLIEHRPDVVCYEGGNLNNSGKSSYAAKRSMAAAEYQVGKVIWRLSVSDEFKHLGLQDMEPYEINSSAMKKHICNNGRAKKHEVRAMVKKILKMKESEVESDDHTDALGIALTYATRP